MSIETRLTDRDDLFDRVDKQLEKLQEKPRHGLAHPVKEFRRAHAGASLMGKKIHYWIHVGKEWVGLRIIQFACRPKRRCLRDLSEKTEPATLFVFSKMRDETILHRLAQCINTGLNRIRRGFINILRFRSSANDSGGRFADNCAKLFERPAVSSA